MISVKDAKQIVIDNIVSLKESEVSLPNAAGLVLAEDVWAPYNIPAFNQSAMDGYAFSFDGYQPGKPLPVIGEVPAGVSQQFPALQGSAVRIFTGAPVPEGADTVVMQEKVERHDNQIIILDEQISKGANVRPVGSEIKTGELALEKGSVLSPAAIGFLAGIGIPRVKVYPHPKVTILVTGKELQQPGKPLSPGQVYESNSLTLQTALKLFGVTSIEIQMVDDDLEILSKTLQQAVIHSDMVLLTGGISVGEYDFVLQAANICGINKHFHKIRQRPGKPLFFGKHDEKVIFGLPGNPSSVLTCFYEYVVPAIEQLSARKNLMRTAFSPLKNCYQKKTGLTHFLKGQLDTHGVSILNAQESFRLSSFARANCLVVLEEEKEDFLEGDLVEVHVLPL